MRVGVTDHAVCQFVERHAPDLTFAEARMYLEEAAKTACPLKERTISGEWQWRVDEPPCVLVMKRDVGDQWVVVTVLPAREESFSDKLAREASEAEADRLAPPLSLPTAPVSRTAVIEKENKSPASPPAPFKHIVPVLVRMRAEHAAALEGLRGVSGSVSQAHHQIELEALRAKLARAIEYHASVVEGNARVLERSRAHGAHMAEEREAIKRGLRTAVLFLREVVTTGRATEDEAAAALAAIEVECPFVAKAWFSKASGG